MLVRMSLTSRLIACFAPLGSAWTYAAEPVHTPDTTKQNIVYILCDDLGYGDVHCLNPTRGKIATPNVDRLATQGMACTNTHSGSSVCTPRRYGILTGRYACGSRLQSGGATWIEPAVDRAGAAHRRRNAQAARLYHGRDRQVAPRAGVWGERDVDPHR